MLFKNDYCGIMGIIIILGSFTIFILIMLLALLF